ncbi:MAG: ATP-grasp domain-containing protein [Gemmataceae bacterium]
MTAPTVLCVTSYFKGNRFLRRAKRDGAAVILLTAESLRDAKWERDALNDLFLMPDLADPAEVIRGVAYLMKTRPFTHVVALDDYDVELGAALREQFRLGGVGTSDARHFRDKLAMRQKARELGVPVPEFTALFHLDDVRRFLAAVPPPWLVKPRHEASSIGIKKFADPDDVWRRIDELGDESSYHLLERFVPSDLFHVDSLVSGGQVVFAEAGRYHRPLLEVYTGGGIFATRTADRAADDVKAMLDLNAKLLPGFGLRDGCSHTEFLRSRADGTLLFLETSYRVGGAGIADLVEAATGLNLWEEWAAVELSAPGAYRVPPLRRDFGGAVVSLARTETPDTAPFDDPEVYHRMEQPHHIGLILRSADSGRIDALLTDYMARIARDHQAVLPPADKATA